MNPVLVYLAHADPSIASTYRSAFAAAGLDVDLVLVNRFLPDKLSSAYYELAQQLTRAGRILPMLRAKYTPPRNWASYSARLFASYSAGYGIVGPLLACRADADELDGYVAIDSFHTRFDADHTASDMQLSPLVALALAAKSGPRILWYGHTDVQTPQTGPKAYASTTQVAQELERLAGGQEGGFHVEAFNLTRDQPQEHRWALTKWGPDFLARAIAEVLARKAAAGTLPPPPAPAEVPTTPLGEDAVLWSLHELAEKHGEIPPGSEAGKWVELYFSGAERGGKPLPLKKGYWCIAAACCAAFQVAAGRKVPHRWRAAVREVWEDACSVEFGSARSAELVRAGRYIPRRGDLWIATRGAAAVHKPGSAAFAKSGGLGHAARLLGSPDANGDVRCIDANHGSGWAETVKNIYEDTFVGVVAYDADREIATDFEVAQLARLRRLEDPAYAGRPLGISVLDVALSGLPG